MSSGMSDIVVSMNYDIISHRMGRTTFERLVERLETLDIFESTGRKPQRPVRYQLGCFLIRFGMRGSDTLTTAQMMGIGHGTVHLYCDRVTWALRHFGLQWVQWTQRGGTRAWVHARTGLTHCVGLLDASGKTAQDHMTFKSSKQVSG